MKPGPKELVITDLIIIDTEGASEDLDLSEMKLDLNSIPVQYFKGFKKKKRNKKEGK